MISRLPVFNSLRSAGFRCEYKLPNPPINTTPRPAKKVVSWFLFKRAALNGERISAVDTSSEPQARENPTMESMLA